MDDTSYIGQNWYQSSEGMGIKTVEYIGVVLLKPSVHLISFLFLG